MMIKKSVFFMMLVCCVAVTGNTSASMIKTETLSPLMSNMCALVEVDCRQQPAARDAKGVTSVAVSEDIFVRQRISSPTLVPVKPRSAVIQTILDTRRLQPRGGQPSFQDQELVSTLQIIDLQENGFTQIEIEEELPLEAPLPGSLWAMIFGLMSLGLFLRRRKTAA